MMAEADVPIPALTPVAKPLNLIPVGLKEAAFDSPTFRGTVIHFGEQLDVVEKWLDSYIRSASRLANEVTALENIINTYLSWAAPPQQVSEALLDHDYTVLALKRYNEGAKEFWSSTIKWMKKVESSVVEPIKAFIQTDVAGLKNARRYLDHTQRVYDSSISRYAAQSKTKEGSSLREDAFQLHEARKAYLKASMDYCVAAPQVRAALDKLLVKVFSDRWRDMKQSRDALANSFGKWSGDVERVRGWSREMENGERVFKRELQQARKQIEDAAEMAIRPSRELDDYAVSTVPYLGSSSIRSPKKDVVERSDKQGWLFQRTITGKPSRTVWVRRWFYVKNGIFGWLNNNARTGAVEESEKTGVLLCGIRPALQEERRFCFEVKTKDSTIVLQAETQPELVEWIAAFEVAKRKALENPASTDAIAAGSKSVDAAFAISPPVAQEFSARTGETSQQDESTIERSATLGVEPGALATRSSMDMGRPSVAGERAGESSRDHAARIIQKLDLHRKTTLSPQTSGSGSPAGGIASLISASHTVLPMGGVAPPLNISTDFKAVLGNSLPMSSLAPSTLANPPAPTNLSKTAVVVSGERSLGLGTTTEDGGGMPGALMANVWGSVNWGWLSRVERGEFQLISDKPKDISPPPSPFRALDVGDRKGEIPEESPLSGSVTPVPHRKTHSMSTADLSRSQPNTVAMGDCYPNYYPQTLKAQDTQFRMLFPNVKREDKLVLVFRATWNPNDQQEFPGRVYVTTHDIYFYSHHLGLVLITGISLEAIQDVTAAPGKDCDFLFLHIKADYSADGSTRLTIKTFLEPLKLLQRRLNFLVRNIDAEEPLSLEEVVKTLIKMEAIGADESPSLESWEDVSPNTPIDSYGRATDSKVGLRIDGNLYPNPHRRVSKNATKFRLPGQPVVYVPQGMTLPVIAKVFDITAKALFHVLAGDKSAVFQMLNVENGAEDLIQSPWTQPDQGHHRRTFQYQVTSGSKRKDVVDYQIIDVLTDHLCYVITDRRTPWSLPYSRDFSLVTKIVITHVAKSQCKLAIYTKVDWRRVPILGRNLIEAQALDDLRLYASSLNSTLADQISRLGSQAYSNSRKAVHIFGQVGVQTQSAQITASDLPPMDPGRRIVRYTLPELAFIAGRKTVFHTIATTLGLLLNLLTAIADVVTAHKVLFGLFILSASTNFFFSSRDSWGWWRERKAARFMARMDIRPNAVIGRSIWLKDLDNFVAGEAGNKTDIANLRSPCVSQFTTLLSQVDPSAPTYSHTVATPKLTRLQRSREHIGSYRHDLLVALRVVERVEREILEAEWESWVWGEAAKCKQTATILKKRKNGNDDETKALREWWDGYCGSCLKEVEGLRAL